MTMTEYLQLTDWQKQAHKDATVWHHDKLESGGDEVKEAYEAGHDRGWHDCLNSLKLHKLITIK